MKHITILIFLIFFGLIVKAQQIIDNGVFLNDNEKSELTIKMQNIKNQSTVETLIYTISDLNGKSPIEYGMEIGRKYPVGAMGINNGVVILLSKNDRKLQILTGYGLEWTLPNDETQLIVNKMISFFKKGEFYNGIDKALDLIDENVIDIDWKSYKLHSLTDKDNGKIFRIEYSNKSGDRKYKYALDTDPQFSNDFKIKLDLDDNKYDLYYSKYMNKMISKILTTDKITIYFRLVDYKKQRLELIGIK